MTSASVHAAEFRAAGTDLSERRRSGVSQGPLIDISAGPDTIGIGWSTDGAVRIGALTSIAAIAADARIAQAYPGLAAAALGLATPQVRHLATLGGNLAQRSRCWYFRNPHIACLKKGGTECPARAGNHLYSVAFDLGPCVAPHPSTMAAALLAYARSTSAPSAAAMRNGRWSKYVPAPSSQAARSSSSASLPAGLRRSRSACRRPRPRCRTRWQARQTLPMPRDRRPLEQSRCR
jgi:xanthine dehydrogenase YagS FAD-binding subunit